MKDPDTYPQQQKEQAPGRWMWLLSHRRSYALILLICMGLFFWGGKSTVDCYMQTRNWAETWNCLTGQPYNSATLITDIPAKALPPSPQPDPEVARQARAPIPLDIPHSGVIKEDVSDLSKPWYWPYQPLLFGGLAGLILLGYAFYELYLASRRKYLRTVERQRSAPLYWDLKVSKPLIALARESDFKEAVLTLHAKTAAKGSSDKPSYIVLIEKRSPHDHLAMLYDQVAHYLWRQDFPLVRYFFQQDPRACWDEEEGEGLFLDELHKLHPDKTLVIVSSSARFFDPLTGELLDWVDKMLAWEKRVLMAVDPPLSWDYKDKVLAEKFTFLPATIEALGVLGKVLTDEEAPSLDYWVNHNQYPPLPSGSEEEHPDFGDLQHYLGTQYAGKDHSASSPDAQAMNAWLGACALYPELSWDLTLALGEGIGRSYQIQLCTPRKLYKLVSLPWFREGYLPDQLRDNLLKSLGKRDLAIARQVLVELLQEHPPPEGSYAASEHELFLAIQEVQLNPGFFKRIKLARQIQDYSFNHELRDTMSLDFLKQVPLGLPNWFRENVFVQGIPALGLQRWMRGTLALGVSILLLLSVDYNRWFVLYQFRGEQYYLATEADRMRFYTHQGNVAVAEANLEAARQYYLQSQELSESLEAEEYVAPDFNLGVVALEQGADDSAKVHFDRVQEKVALTLADREKPDRMKKGLDSINIRAHYNEGLVAYRSSELDSSEAAFRVSSQSDSLYAASRYAEGVILLQKALDSQGADRANKLRLAYQRFEEAAGKDSTVFSREKGIKPQMGRLRNSSPDSLWQAYLDRIEDLWKQTP